MDLLTRNIDSLEKANSQLEIDIKEEEKADL